MEVILAKKAGFCFGVNRAVDTAFQAANNNIENNLPVYTFGPIIHNMTVVEDLKEHGVGMIETLDELQRLPKSRIIIRSHGVDRK